MLTVRTPVRSRLGVHTAALLIARSHVARRPVRGMLAVRICRARGCNRRVCGQVSFSRSELSVFRFSSGGLRTNCSAATFPPRSHCRSLGGVDTDVGGCRGTILTGRKQDTRHSRRWASPRPSRRSVSPPEAARRDTEESAGSLR